MARTGSRGDSIGSVASCPGLRVKYWKLRSGAIEIENPRRPRGMDGEMQLVQNFFQKKRREKEPHEREKKRGYERSMYDMTYCFKHM